MGLVMLYCGDRDRGSVDRFQSSLASFSFYFRGRQSSVCEVFQCLVRSLSDELIFSEFCVFFCLVSAGSIGGSEDVGDCESEGELLFR